VFHRSKRSGFDELCSVPLHSSSSSCCCSTSRSSSRPANECGRKYYSIRNKQQQKMKKNRTNRTLEEEEEEEEEEEQNCFRCVFQKKKVSKVGRRRLRLFFSHFSSTHFGLSLYCRGVCKGCAHRIKKQKREREKECDIIIQ
jgi:hypothetical protein